MTRLLVLGRNGQLARALVACDSEFDVLALGRPGLDILTVQGTARAIAAHQPGIVINTAAFTDVDGAESAADEAFALNRDAARDAANMARKAGAAFIHISTDYVFDGAKGAPYEESDRPNPQGAYARSKAEGEAAVMDAHPDALVVRTSGLFSQTGRNFVRAVASRLIQTGEANIVTDQCLNPTYAPDLAAALLQLAQAFLDQRAEPGLYHAAGGESATWFEVGEAIQHALGARNIQSVIHPVTTKDWGAAAPRPADSRLADTKLAALGIGLPSFRQAIPACVEAARRVQG